VADRPDDGVAGGFKAGAFSDSVAIVTGAASGIGRALAAVLVRRGAHVVLADIDESGAKAAAGALQSEAVTEVTAVGLDVRDADAVAELVQQTARERGRLDLMFNNAGIGITGPVAQMTVEHFDRLIDVNLRGVVHGVLAAYPIMIRQRSGHLVNTASLAGLLPSPMLTGYGMTKHGVVGLSMGLRMEAAAHNVRVSAVCPGVIDTPLLDKPNPADLPPVEGVPNAREILTRVIGEVYPAAALAEDVLAGVARNRPLIVTPRHARIPWYLYRVSPRLILEGGPRALRRTLGGRARHPG
jgi:NAD(P)-dependent dehydrogenase (short-subunit alcohol dehydrogenase family)